MERTMPAGQKPLDRIVRRGIRWQLIGMGFSLALAALVAASAREHRLQAMLLLLVGVGFVLDAWGLRANGALLAVAQPPRPSWIPWVSGLAFTLGATLVVCAIAFLWHPRAGA
jgi:hypothetical protein